MMDAVSLVLLPHLPSSLLKIPRNLQQLVRKTPLHLLVKILLSPSRKDFPLPQVVPTTTNAPSEFVEMVVVNPVSLTLNVQMEKCVLMVVAIPPLLHPLQLSLLSILQVLQEEVVQTTPNAPSINASMADVNPVFLTANVQMSSSVLMAPVKNPQPLNILHA